MGKTITFHNTISEANIHDNSVRYINGNMIDSVEGSNADLEAQFNSAEIDAVINTQNADGIRFYPAAYNNELIMLAFPTRGNNDLVGTNIFCVACNVNGSIEVDGGEYVNGVHCIRSSEEAYKLVDGEGSDESVVDRLRELREMPQSTQKFKARFDSDFFREREYDQIRFEILDMNFHDYEGRWRSVASTLMKDGHLTFNAISMLPCPPNCGGVYG